MITTIEYATYDRSDFEQFLDDPSLYGSTGAAGDSVTFTDGLDPVDVRQFDKFKALYENNENFRATWDRKRTDESFRSDPSASNYCTSIAVFLVKNGWTDNDELIAAHYWWRGTHGELATHRPDKSAHQIATARKLAADDEAAAARLSIPNNERHVHGIIELAEFVFHDLLSLLPIESSRTCPDDRESDGLETLLAGQRHRILDVITDRPFRGPP